MTKSTMLAVASPSASGVVDETSARERRESMVSALPRRSHPVSSDVVALNFKVPREFRRHLKVLAAERGVSMTALLERAFECLVNCEMHGGTAGRCD